MSQQPDSPSAIESTKPEVIRMIPSTLQEGVSEDQSGDVVDNWEKACE